MCVDTVAGGVFIFLSIYLGLTRKAGIPTDVIQAQEFGQSKAKSRMEGRTGVRFADVAGLGTIIAELQEVVAFLKEPKRFTAVGARPPRGLLLEGGPGVGKTLVAKAIAGEAGVPFYAMAGSEFVEVIVGVRHVARPSPRTSSRAPRRLAPRACATCSAARA